MHHVAFFMLFLFEKIYFQNNYMLVSTMQQRHLIIMKQFMRQSPFT